MTFNLVFFNPEVSKTQQNNSYRNIHNQLISSPQKEINHKRKTQFLPLKIN